MKSEITNLEGVIVLSPSVYEDERGYFFESFNLKKFQKATNSNFTFVQDNQSKSRKGVLRGLHFQIPPHAQGKLVTVTQGAIIDVAVDIRRGSPTYKKYVSVELNAENKKMLWIPPGFAHGFISLEENTILNYKCTDYYHPECEKSLLWDDPDFQIDWTIENPILSKKDALAQPFVDFISPFNCDDHDK